MISAGRNGVTRSWSKVPCFPLAGDGHGRQQQRLQHTERADQRRDHIPTGFEIGIVPGAHRDPNRRCAFAMVGCPVRIEAIDDGADVAQCRAGRIGVAAVGDHLHVRRATGHEPALEILPDLDNEQGAPFIDQGFDVGSTMKLGHAEKYARAVQCRQQLVGGGTSILVQHRVWHIVEIIGRRVPEDETLQDRREKKTDPAARILENSEQFLVNEGEDAQDRFDHRPPHTSLLVATARVSTSSAAAMAANAAALGRMTPQMSPARNTV